MEHASNGIVRQDSQTQQYSTAAILKFREDGVPYDEKEEDRVLRNRMKNREVSCKPVKLFWTPGKKTHMYILN